MAISQIWGLQYSYILGKSYQIRALHLEAQKKMWLEEFSLLSTALSEVGSGNPYFRSINKSAQAETVTVEPVRRNSSQVSTSDEPKVESLQPINSPMSTYLKKEKKLNVTFPNLSKFSTLSPFTFFTYKSRND